MKAILEFNLDDNDERMAHLRAIKSTSMAVALWDIDQLLRNKTKNEDNEIIENLREEIVDILNDYNINLDELLS
jgi:hypothetical protein